MLACQADGNTTVVGGSDMREYCRKQWRDLLAIACVGAAWLLTAVVGI